MRIGIIGFGNFGKFMAKQLVKKAEVFVTDIVDKSKEAEMLGVKFVSLDKICSQKIIILAVPMSVFIETLKKIKDKLTPGTLVLDVCSLKMFSCKAMEEILPNNVEIIGTHPLFGPESGREGIKGLNIALVNVRSKKLENVKKFCESLGLKVFITTPEEHDKQMAFSQALTHFLGNVAKNMKLKKVTLSTKTYDDLMNIMITIQNDSKELFENIQKMNPFAKKVRENFIKQSEKLNNYLNSLGKP